ncbi:MAG: sugar phosphate isomerase/epimerase [Lentisphaeria bacterium]|nr:sugar phosphate isomerase/epimerase [Lentisphaeria bacterium]
MEHIIGCTTRPYKDLPLDEALARIAAAGYTDVALFNQQGQVPVRADSTPSEVAAARQAAADAGVTPSMVIGGTQLGLPLDEAVDNYRRLITNVAAVGATWLLDCGTSNEAAFDKYLELMKQAASHAQDAGVRITMKPHGGISLTAKQLQDAHRRVDHPAFTICYDPGNILYYTKGERTPEEDVAGVAPIVASVIIKDCAISDGKPDVQVTPGDGLVDFPVVLGALVKADFSGPFYVECVGSSEPDAVDRDVAFALGYVRGILATLKTD